MKPEVKKVTPLRELNKIQRQLEAGKKVSNRRLLKLIRDFRWSLENYINYTEATDEKGVIAKHIAKRIIRMIRAEFEVEA